MTFDHYTIRLATEQDAGKFFRIVEENRKRLEDFFAGTVSKTKTLTDTEAFMKERMKLMSEKKYFPFLVIDNETERVVGFIDVKNIDWNIPKAELGCFLDANYTTLGLSKKALSMVIAHLFAEYKFEKLFLRTHQQNTAARRLAEGCGFEVEGIIRKDYKTTSGEVIDLVYYGLLKK
jgi:RimJ/RimL family protein N-acetyltransferase